LTAAFNKNLLLRINTELLADFDLTAFAHRAVWNAGDRRVEMHLVSLRAQTVRIPRAECEVAFAQGEPIWTESSYKYDADELAVLVEAQGFRCHERWIEPEARFALTLFTAA
jgi:L-histidine N-alpha-methyltransferase